MVQKEIDMGKKTFGADLYGKGENPNGIVSQTSDGTVKNAEALPPQNYSYNQRADGARWNCDDDKHSFKRNQPFPPPKTR